MSKRDELKSLIDADSVDSTRIEPSKAVEQTIKKAAQQTEEDESVAQKEQPEAAVQEEKSHEIEEKEQDGGQPQIHEREATNGDLEQIAQIQQRQEYWVHILDAYATDSNGKRTTRFDKNDAIQIHIICSATEILSRLKASFHLDAVSQDLLNLVSQRLYSFDLDGKLQFPNFEINYEIDAALRGVFRYHFVLRLNDVDCMCVHDACVFQVV